MKRVVGVVPARLQSSRLSRKPLIKICGRTLLDHTLVNLKEKASFNEIIVLGDDEEILNEGKRLGFKSLMTPECSSGLERICFARKELKGFDLIAHIQCDEPNVSSNVLKALCEVEDAPVKTLACPIDEKSAELAGNVKVVFDRFGKALYFSRAMIPFSREKKAQYYKHIGLYAYKREFLDHYETLEKGQYEEIEMLEQLTLLENGIDIKVGIVDEEPFGIDTQEDIGEFTTWLQQNTSLSPEASSPL